MRLTTSPYFSTNTFYYPFFCVFNIDQLHFSYRAHKSSTLAALSFSSSITLSIEISMYLGQSESNLSQSYRIYILFSIYFFSLVVYVKYFWLFLLVFFPIISSLILYNITNLKSKKIKCSNRFITGPFQPVQLLPFTCYLFLFFRYFLLHFVFFLPDYSLQRHFIL